MLAFNVLFSLPSVTCHRKIVSVRWWWLPQSFTFLWQHHLNRSGIWALLTSKETLIAFHVIADFQRLKYLLLGKTHQSVTGQTQQCVHRLFCKVETSEIPEGIQKSRELLVWGIKSEDYYKHELLMYCVQGLYSKVLTEKWLAFDLPLSSGKANVAVNLVTFEGRALDAQGVI